MNVIISAPPRSAPTPANRDAASGIDGARLVATPRECTRIIAHSDDEQEAQGGGGGAVVDAEDNEDAVEDLLLPPAPGRCPSKGLEMVRIIDAHAAVERLSAGGLVQGVEDDGTEKRGGGAAGPAWLAGPRAPLKAWRRSAAVSSCEPASCLPSQVAC